MRDILHHLETMVEAIVCCTDRKIIIFPGFLNGGAVGISQPSTIIIPGFLRWREIHPHYAHGRDVGMAMGHNPVPPVNIPIPTKIGSKMGGEFTYQPKYTFLSHLVLTPTAVSQTLRGASPPVRGKASRRSWRRRRVGERRRRRGSCWAQAEPLEGTVFFLRDAPRKTTFVVVVFLGGPAKKDAPASVGGLVVAVGPVWAIGYPASSTRTHTHTHMASLQGDKQGFWARKGFETTPDRPFPGLSNSSSTPPVRREHFGPQLLPGGLQLPFQAAASSSGGSVP